MHQPVFTYLFTPPFYFRTFNVTLKPINNILQKHTVLFFPSEQFFMHCIIFSAQDSWLCCLHFNDGGLDVEAAVLSTKGFHRRYFI